MNAAQTEKRYRPLGLSLAILATALLYGIWPMMPVLLMLWINAQGRLIGADIVNSLGWINAGLGLLTLAACIRAWIGRPPWSRWFLIAVILLATAFQLYQVAQTLFSRTSGVGQVGGNLSALGQPLALCQLPLLVVVSLYIIWYMNRTPARAFYDDSR